MINDDDDIESSKQMKNFDASRTQNRSIFEIFNTSLVLNGLGDEWLCLMVWK